MLADAALIAAAPDLLEACKRMFKSLAAFLDYVDDVSYKCYAPEQALEIGRDAIAKAEGKA